ncbi:hypothetical protein [Catenulispora yoronensis]|uniref:hypothetical protein n=1 Tax=Catenulispora yoronensis TaxID=450799 RepID=UPI0031E01903
MTGSIPGSDPEATSRDASFWSLVAGTLRRTRTHPLSADWIPVLAAVALALAVSLGWKATW